MRRTCNGFASATVAADEPCKSRDRLVPDLGVRIRCQRLTDISHNLGDADVLMTAPLTGESVKSALADRGDRIAQRTTKSVRRHFAGVMIQQEQAETPHRQIGMAECSDLHSGDGKLSAEARTTLLRARDPSMNKITGDFEVSSGHCSISAACRVGTGASTGFDKQTASRAPCPPDPVRLASRLMVGTARKRPCLVERPCQRLCPPYSCLTAPA